MSRHDLGKYLEKHEIFEHKDDPHTIVRRYGLEIEPDAAVQLLEAWKHELELLRSLGLQLAPSKAYYNAEEHCLYQYVARIPTGTEFLLGSAGRYFQRGVVVDPARIKDIAASVVNSYMALGAYFKTKLQPQGYIMWDIVRLRQYVIHQNLNQLVLVDQMPELYDLALFPKETASCMFTLIREWEQALSVCAPIVGCVNQIQDFNEDLRDDIRDMHRY